MVRSGSCCPIRELGPEVSPRARLFATSIVAAALAGVPAVATAQSPAGDSATASERAPSAAEPAPDSPAESAPAPAPAPAPTPTSAPAPAPMAAPADAVTALQRARAAYEYGDMEMVVESARLVAEGRLRPTPPQRAQALRYLGIGLYLTGRSEGAETTFFELLRLRPDVRLDPTTTRPDAVAFFEDVRRRHADEIRQAARHRPGKNLVLAFLPPLGQFQNGHRARGYTIAALEVLSLGGAIATKLQLDSWARQYPGQTFGPHADAAHTLKALNVVSVAVLVAAVVAGIVDGVAGYNTDIGEPQISFVDGGGLGLRF
jgi:hypothetical protein